MYRVTRVVCNIHSIWAAGVIVLLALNQVFVANHQGHPVKRQTFRAVVVSKCKQLDGKQLDLSPFALQQQLM